MKQSFVLRGDLQKAHQRLLRDPETFATVVLAIYVSGYEPEEVREALSWTPTSYRMELEDRYHIQIPDLLVEKLAAAASILLTDRFYRSVRGFIEICNTLSGSSVTPGVFDPADSMECAWGITEALLLEPPDSEEPFSEDILYYIGGVLNSEGIKNPPDVLRVGRWEAQSDYAGLMADDPAMFSAMSAVHEEDGQLITQELTRRIQRLIGQLEDSGTIPAAAGQSNIISLFRQNLATGREALRTS